jgi:hypothetical protein
MMCLDCGQDIPYETESCSGCNNGLAVFSPFLHANHVSQLQEAMRVSDEAAFDWVKLANRYERFAEKSMLFSERWGQQFQQRLSPEMRGRFGTAMSEIDESLTHLEEAQSFLDEAFETQNVQLLEEADVALTFFFKLACAGCAAIIDELEQDKDQPDAVVSGGLFDHKGL